MTPETIEADPFPMPIALIAEPGPLLASVPPRRVVSPAMKEARAAWVHPQAWTAEDDANLIDGRAAGLSLSQIAGAMGRTVGACTFRSKVLKRRGVDLPPVKGKLPEDERARRQKEVRARSKARWKARRAAMAPAVDLTSEPKPRALAVVKAAIRDLRETKPVDTTYQPTATRGPGSDMRRAVLARLDLLEGDAGWDPQRDLTLVEAILAGQRYEGAAKILGVTVEAVAARWNRITAPIKRDGARLVGPKGQRRRVPIRVNDIEGQAFVVAELRRRASGQVAA